MWSKERENPENCSEKGHSGIWSLGRFESPVESKGGRLSSCSRLSYTRQQIVFVWSVLSKETFQAPLSIVQMCGLAPTPFLARHSLFLCNAPPPPPIHKVPRTWFCHLSSLLLLSHRTALLAMKTYVVSLKSVME